MSLEKQKFNCVLNDINGVTKALDIKITKEDFAKTYEKVLANTAQKIKINGFRPGKAPRNMIESMYKEALIADAKEKLVREAIDDGIKENNLKVLQISDVNFKEDTKEDGFTFCATVEVFPTPPDVPNFDGINVEAKKDEFTQDKVDNAIKEFTAQFSKFESVKDRTKPTEDDTIKFNFEVSYNNGTGDESREITRSFDKNAWNIEGSASFDSALRDLLLGMSLNETKECKSTIKISNKNGDFEPGDATYKVTLTDIMQKVTPELTDDFVKGLQGFELNSVKEFQDRMTDVIKSEIVKANEDRKRMAVMHKLLESYDFEIPQVMLDNEIENLLNMQGGQYAKPIKLSDVSEETKNHIRGVYNNAAKERIQVAFLIDAVAKKENIEANDEDYNDYLNKIAEETHVSLDKIKHDVKANNIKQSIMLELKRTKTWDMLCSKANISYVALDSDSDSSKDKQTKTKKASSKKNTDNVADDASNSEAKKAAPKKASAKKASDEDASTEEAPKAKRGRKKKEEA